MLLTCLPSLLLILGVMVGLQTANVKVDLMAALSLLSSTIDNSSVANILVSEPKRVPAALCAVLLMPCRCLTCLA